MLKSRSDTSFKAVPFFDFDISIDVVYLIYLPMQELLGITLGIWGKLCYNRAINMIIDVFTYNGEKDILDLRLNILDEYVDQFIIVEASTTFSGLPKPLYYEQQKDQFKKWQKKIKYFVVDENYTDHEKTLAQNSPNTVGADHWKREFLQKESIKKALTHLQDDDICYISDVDEIFDPHIDPEILTADKVSQMMMPWRYSKMKQLVYAYYLNNRSSEEWQGTLVTKYKYLKDKCLNHIRTRTRYNLILNGGWHFTSMGGEQELRRKLRDSYTEETYNNKWVQDNLKDNIEKRKDFLGRRIDFAKDETDWPQYLKDNREKYQHLCL